MNNLEKGQRIDVINTLPDNYYGLEPRTYIGERRDTGFADCFYTTADYRRYTQTLCFFPQHVKKIGTFIVKSLKGGNG